MKMNREGKGKLFLVGTGPGDRLYMTLRAEEVISECEVVVGYTRYIKLLGELTAGKEVITSGMHREKDRCARAVSEARQGRKVALVSGGDAGIYGMAGIALQIITGKDISGKDISGNIINEKPAHSHGNPADSPQTMPDADKRDIEQEVLPEVLPGFEEDIDVEIVPGVTAATAAASRLGAPLMHDFAVISLSDLLTERDLIKKRLIKAIEADFILVIYNPSSHNRREFWEEALTIITDNRAETTPVGIVRNAYREDEEKTITTLQEVRAQEVDMSATVIVGNSQTYIRNNYMITPRGYLL